MKYLEILVLLQIINRRTVTACDSEWSTRSLWLLVWPHLSRLGKSGAWSLQWEPPGLKSRLCHCDLGERETSLSLSFLICGMGTIIHPSHRGVMRVGRINMCSLSTRGWRPAVISPMPSDLNPGGSLVNGVCWTKWWPSYQSWLV